mmetsp:Transcript_21258/g.54808  ORF Transcript_21258/g.54808 Transcript_21258/m.54808 type:complete len:280 (+) Transcript_21258:387-1226(+)
MKLAGVERRILGVIQCMLPSLEEPTLETKALGQWRSLMSEWPSQLPRVMHQGAAAAALRLAAAGQTVRRASEADQRQAAARFGLSTAARAASRVHAAQGAMRGPDEPTPTRCRLGASGASRSSRRRCASTARFSSSAPITSGTPTSSMLHRPAPDPRARQHVAALVLGHRARQQQATRQDAHAARAHEEGVLAAVRSEESAHHLGAPARSARAHPPHRPGRVQEAGARARLRQRAPRLRVRCHKGQGGGGGSWQGASRVKAGIMGWKGHAGLWDTCLVV